MSNLILNKLNSLQKQKNNSKFWNITYEQGVFLENLVELKNPKRVLEIGTSNGFSTLFLAKRLNAQSVIDTIEVNEERFLIARKNFEFCNLNFINQYLGQTFDILPRLQFIYDLVFIDALQSQYLELIQKIEKNKLLSKDSIIVFDNINSHDHMKDFIEYVKSNYHFEFINIGGGMLFLTKSTL